MVSFQGTKAETVHSPPTILGLPSPFFPGIILSRKPLETQGKRIRISKRRMVEKNGPGINPSMAGFPQSFLLEPGSHNLARRPFRAARHFPHCPSPGASPSINALLSEESSTTGGGWPRFLSFWGFDPEESLPCFWWGEGDWITLVGEAGCFCVLFLFYLFIFFGGLDRITLVGEAG